MLRGGRVCCFERVNIQGQNESYQVNHSFNLFTQAFTHSFSQSVGPSPAEFSRAC